MNRISSGSLDLEFTDVDSKPCPVCNSLVITHRKTNYDANNHTVLTKYTAVCSRCFKVIESSESTQKEEES
jgi:hypothetical protein